MGWLGLKKRPGHDRKATEDAVQEETGPLPSLPPVLNLLVPDIAGVTSFRLRQFLNVDDAADFVRSVPTISGLHAFWGLHAPPPGTEAGEGTGEAMVLIRAAENSDTVYVVSFVDLDSALSFARFEVKRGMNLGLLLIYWAEIVDVQVDESGVRFTPDAPPLPGFEAPSFEPVLPADEVEPVVEPEPALEAVATVEPPSPEPEPEPAVLEETEDEQPLSEPELDWKTEVTEEFERETEEEFEKFVAEQEGLRTSAEQATAATPEAEPVAEAESPAPADDEMDIEREAVAFLKASATGKIASKQPTEARTPAVEEPAQPVQEPGELVANEAPESAAHPESVATTPAVEPEPATVPPIEEPAPPPAQVPPAIEETWPTPVRIRVADQQEHEPETDEDTSEHMVEEVEKILKVKRWDKRESPFRGFDSPPGRF